MRIKVEPSALIAACEATIKDIDEGRASLREDMIATEMKKKIIRIEDWRLVRREKTREEAIKSLSYGFSDYEFVVMKWWKQREKAESFLAAAKAGGYITLSDDDFSWIAKFYKGGE